jgi:transposase-like protein
MARRSRYSQEVRERAVRMVFEHEVHANFSLRPPRLVD